jgi:hypothetical protein
VGKTDTRDIGNQIRFLCTSHATEVPIVTMHEERWAYCPGGFIASKPGHFWTAIEPVDVSDLKPKHIGFAPTQRLSRST